MDKMALEKPLSDAEFQSNKKVFKIESLKKYQSKAKGKTKKAEEKQLVSDIKAFAELQQ